MSTCVSVCLRDGNGGDGSMAARRNHRRRTGVTDGDERAFFSPFSLANESRRREVAVPGRFRQKIRDGRIIYDEQLNVSFLFFFSSLVFRNTSKYGFLWRKRGMFYRILYGWFCSVLLFWSSFAVIGFRTKLFVFHWPEEVEWIWFPGRR